MLTACAALVAFSAPRAKWGPKECPAPEFNLVDVSPSGHSISAIMGKRHTMAHLQSDVSQPCLTINFVGLGMDMTAIGMKMTTAVQSSKKGQKLRAGVQPYQMATACTFANYSRAAGDLLVRQVSVETPTSAPTTAPTSSPTTPTTAPTSAPTTPTTAPTSAPTTPTPSPTSAPTASSTSTSAPTPSPTSAGTTFAPTSSPTPPPPPAVAARLARWTTANYTASARRALEATDFEWDECDMEAPASRMLLIAAGWWDPVSGKGLAASGKECEPGRLKEPRGPDGKALCPNGELMPFNWMVIANKMPTEHVEDFCGLNNDDGKAMMVVETFDKTYSHELMDHIEEELRRKGISPHGLVANEMGACYN